MSPYELWQYEEVARNVPGFKPWLESEPVLHVCQFMDRTTQEMWLCTEPGCPNEHCGDCGWPPRFGHRPGCRATEGGGWKEVVIGIKQPDGWRSCRWSVEYTLDYLAETYGADWRDDCETIDEFYESAMRPVAGNSGV